FAVLLVGAIWVANRLRSVAPRVLAYGSIVVYLLSLFVPAWPGSNVEFGVGLMWMSTILTVTFNLFDQYTGGWLGVQIAVGVIANLAFLVGYICLLVGIKWRAARRVAGWCATISVVAALATVPMMALGAPADSPVFPTFGLWLASPWALLLGTWGM